MNPPSEADCKGRSVMTKRRDEASHSSSASPKRLKVSLDVVAGMIGRNDAGNTRIASKKVGNLVDSGRFGASGKTPATKPIGQEQLNENAANLMPGSHPRDKDLEQEPTEYLIKFPCSQGGGSAQSTKPSLRRSMLARELRILCVLRHERIVKLHQVSSFPSSEPYVVIDRLVGTLDDRFKMWRGRSVSNDMRERLLIVHGIASAISHLHSRKIIFRALDPSNVGFDSENRPKLFNFSLVKQLPQAGNIKDVYHLTAQAGFRNYIAPCNYLGEPYGLSADVYSLSILSWEILAARRAFEDIVDESEYVAAVVEGRARPAIPSSWPLLLRNVLRYGWAKTSSTRPTAQVIYAALDQYLFGTTVQSPLIEYIQCLLLSNGTFMDL